MQEEWKQVQGYNEEYIVSNTGIVKSFRNNSIGKILSPSLDSSVNGYYRVRIYKGNNIKYIRVHRIVANSFLKRIEGKNEVNHKNGNKKDNRVENLEWCTRSENAKHAHMTGLCNNRGEKFGRVKLTDEKVIEIRALNLSGVKHKELSKIYNVHPSNIWYICNRKTWMHI